MSSSLVRKALELVDTEPASTTQPLKKARKNDSRKGLKSKKQSHKGQSSRVLGDVRSEAALQVELARRTSNNTKDRTKENLKNLIALGNLKSVDFKKAQKIFDGTVKRRRPIDDSAPDSGPTAFTEEDFRKFEEEYFVN